MYNSCCTIKNAEVLMLCCITYVGFIANTHSLNTEHNLIQTRSGREEAHASWPVDLNKLHQLISASLCLNITTFLCGANGQFGFVKINWPWKVGIPFSTEYRKQCIGKNINSTLSKSFHSTVFLAHIQCLKDRAVIGFNLLMEPQRMPYTLSPQSL